MELGKILGFSHRKEEFKDRRTRAKGDLVRGHSIFIFPEQESGWGPTTHAPQGKGWGVGGKHILTSIGM